MKKRPHDSHKRGTFPDGDSQGLHDEYNNAQLVDIGTLERAYRETDSARRQTTISWSIAILCLLIAAVLAMKDHTEALVYRENGSGQMILMGYAGMNRTPTTLTVQNSLAHWIQNVRDIPANDPALTSRNRNEALVMVAKGSEADTHLHGYFSANDPATVEKSVQRTVSSAHVQKRSDITYDVMWTEQTTTGGNATGSNTYQGTITLAAPPAAPTDPLLGESNPAGVFIATYFLAAPNS